MGRAIAHPKGKIMPKVHLDTTFVNTAICPPGKRKIDYYSDSIPGFLLEVRATGGRTFYQRYYDPSGRLKAFKLGSAADITLDRAKKLAAKIRSRATVGEDPVEAKREKRAVPTYSELAHRYLAHTATYQRSPESTERYVRKHIVPRWGRLRLDEVRQEDVALWLEEMRKNGYAPGTIERARVILSHSLKLAMRWGIPGLSVNPVVGIPRPPLNNARERYLSTEEAKRLKVAVEQSRNKQLKYIVGLLLQCGCRVNELLQAEWAHFDLERRLWRIPQSKTGKARFVPLSQGALDLIDALPRYDGCPFLIPNPKTKKPWVQIFTSWDTARKQAGLPDLRIHDLRHSAASFMAAAGIDLYTIGKVLGHSNYKTTARYSHLANDQLIAAVDAGGAKLGVDWAASTGE
jgi:integrase